MAVSIPTLKTANGSTSDGTSYNTASVSWNIGDLVLLAISNAQTSGNAVVPNTPTVAGLTFNLAASINEGTFVHTSLWWAHASAGSSGAINITYSTSQNNCNWAVATVTGHNSVTPILQSKTNTSAGAGGTTIVATLDNALASGSLVFAVGMSGIDGSSTAEATELSDNGFTDGIGGIAAQTLSTQYSTSDTGPTFTFSISDVRRSAITVEIQQGAQLLTPGLATLVLATFAPTILAGTAVTPTTRALVTARFAPVVTATQNVRAVPTPASLVLTTFAPRTTLSGFTPSYVLEVDWDNDDDFGDAHESISAEGVILHLECVMGRDYPSQIIGRSVAGQLRAQLNNSSGLYSPFNASGDLYGLLLPNRKVRLRSPEPVATVMWTGFLTGPPKPEVGFGSLPKASLEAVGPFSLLASVKINPAPMEDAHTGEIIDAILDAAGWPAAARDIDAGEVILKNWYVRDKSALEALQEIEEAEGGFLREGTNWDIIFESRYHRLTDSLSASSQASFDDAGGFGYREVSQEDPLRQIFNNVEVTVQQLREDPSETLWELEEDFILAAGEERTFIADVSDAEIAYVREWTAATILSSGGTVVTSVITTATTAFITVENTHGSQSAAISMLFIAGYPTRYADPVRVRDFNQASIDDYGQRDFPFASPWFANTAYAEAAAELAISRYKDPHPIITIMIVIPTSNFDLFYAVINRKVSHRVSLEALSTQTQLGVDHEFYIESIAHSLGPKSLQRTTWTLSLADTNPGYWVLDTDAFGGTAKLAY